MSKKILSALSLAFIVGITLFSCKKSDNTGDPTLNYFPIAFGKYVTYNVDSIYYYGNTCIRYETKSQLKYVIADSFTNNNNYFGYPYKLTYIMNVYARPYEGALWVPISVILLNQTKNALNYKQDNVNYIKLMFPISNGFSWQGNANAPVNDQDFAFLKGWSYRYSDMHLSYNTGYLNFDNTVTVMEDNESVNYPNVDSGVNAYRTFAKEVYAYNVGMIYKEWTHWTYKANNKQCVDGYTVVMKAVDHN
jgi:hypothetical protein